MNRTLLQSVAAAGMALAASVSFAAATCSLGPGNVGIEAASFSCVVDDTAGTITIRETYTNAGIGVVRFDGTYLSNYTVTKIITNSSGTDWTRMANELLDPAGQANDSIDVLPYPSFVPAGWTTSNDADGLSFDQGGSIAKSGGVFGSVQVDELTNVRDFIDFFNGTHLNSTVNTISFGLDTGGSDNEPFLLVQRPNESSVVPEPATLALVGAALFGLGASRRRRG